MVGGISPISGYVGFQAYIPPYQRTSAYGNSQGAGVAPVSASGPVTGVGVTDGVSMAKEDAKKASRVGETDTKKECQTCKERKYQDGSDENVSFKSAQKIAPGAVASRVRGHEQEHVANAYDKAAKDKNAKVLQASVTMKMAICPECGKPYIAGGETTTKIAYKKDNPYGKNQQSSQYEAASGKNVDLAV